MINNQDYPWYAQQEGTLQTLYEGFYPIACEMTPLGLGDIFNIDSLTGKALITVGYMYGLSSTGAYYNGLRWSVENWGSNVWTGEPQTTREDIYKNYIKMKAYANGRPYTLQLLYDSLKILAEGFPTLQFSVTEDPDTLSFVIEVSSTNSDELEAIQQITFIDSSFLGKPTGISYTWNFTQL